MDAFLTQDSLDSSLEALPEEEGFQIPPPSDPLKNSATSHLIIDIPPEPTVLPPHAAVVESVFKRQNKIANTFIFALIAISFSLIVTIPGPDPDRVFLRAIDPTLAFTSLVVSVRLVFYSFWSHPGAELVKVQATVMGFSSVLLVLAVLARLALLFPCRLLLPLAAIVVMLIALLVLLLYFTRHKNSSRTILPFFTVRLTPS